MKDAVAVGPHALGSVSTCRHCAVSTPPHGVVVLIFGSAFSYGVRRLRRGAPFENAALQVKTPTL